MESEHFLPSKHDHKIDYLTANNICQVVRSRASSIAAALEQVRDGARQGHAAGWKGEAVKLEVRVARALSLSDKRVDGHAPVSINIQPQHGGGALAQGRQRQARTSMSRVQPRVLRTRSLLLTLQSSLTYFSSRGSRRAWWLCRGRRTSGGPQTASSTGLSTVCCVCEAKYSSWHEDACPRDAGRDSSCRSASLRHRSAVCHSVLIRQSADPAGVIIGLPRVSDCC
jgi:hypothetical protein